MIESKEYEKKIDLFLSVLKQSKFGSISVIYKIKKS